MKKLKWSCNATGLNAQSSQSEFSQQSSRTEATWPGWKSALEMDCRAVNGSFPLSTNHSAHTVTWGWLLYQQLHSLPEEWDSHGGKEVSPSHQYCSARCSSTMLTATLELLAISEKPEPERGTKIEWTPRKQTTQNRRKLSGIKMNIPERVKRISHPLKK